MKTAMTLAAGALIVGTTPALLAQHHGTTSSKAAATGSEKHAGHNMAQTVAVVEGVDVANRTITLRGPRGKGITYPIGDEVRNLSEVKVGDPVIAVYKQPLVLDLKKGGAGIRERIERESTAGGAAAREVAAVADVSWGRPGKDRVTLPRPQEAIGKR